jgi:hypothetical protein
MRRFLLRRGAVTVDQRAVLICVAGVGVFLAACSAVQSPIAASDGGAPQRGRAAGGATGADDGTGGADGLGGGGGSPGAAGSDASETGAGGAGAGGRRADGIGGASSAVGGTGGTVRGTGGTVGGTGGTRGSGGMDGSTILSIDFVGGFNDSGAVAGAPGGIPVTPGPVLMADDVAGFKPAPHWNAAFGAVGALSPLALSDGTSVNAALAWSSPPTTLRSGVWRLAFTDSGPDATMMDGYLDPQSTSVPAVVAVANLPVPIATRGYDVYVYCMGSVSSGKMRTYDYRIGTTDVPVTQSGAVTGLFPGYQLVTPSNSNGNVVVFRNLSGATFTLLATPSAGDSTRAPVNGLQIVSPPGS